MLSRKVEVPEPTITTKALKVEVTEATNTYLQLNVIYFQVQRRTLSGQGFTALLCSNTSNAVEEDSLMLEDY